MAPLALVTGASTGIGRACVTHLTSLGFEVLAGVRRPEDAPPGAEPLQLDVTSEADVAAAAERVGARLDALVNNAGIAVSGPLEGVPVAEWRRQMEVNFLGQVAVTQALLPALINARGRVVNMSSIGGRNALPLFGPYSASKFALEAMTDSLRREVASLGVKVVSVEPGGIATPIWGKGLSDADRVLDAMPTDVRRRYAGLIAAGRREAERIGREGLPPEAVAAVVGRALTARRPRTRYLVGRDAKVQAALGRLLPGRAFDALVRLALSAGGRSGARG
jgi:NAD(P)-dependent dehydrogenase (short-subunit alcohol dehydrogenase family)